MDIPAEIREYLKGIDLDRLAEDLGPVIRESLYEKLMGASKDPGGTLDRLSQEIARSLLRAQTISDPKRRRAKIRQLQDQLRVRAEAMRLRTATMNWGPIWAVVTPIIETAVRTLAHLGFEWATGEEQ